MIDNMVLQSLVFAVGVLYLALHAGPMLRLWYEPSIRGGTRWMFFFSEVVLFVAWWQAFPVLWESRAAQAVVLFHIVSHFSYFVADAVAHDRLLWAALIDKQRFPLLWVAKELGLFIDTLSHAFVVVLVAATLPISQVIPLVLLGLAGYGLVTRRYLRQALPPTLKAGGTP